MAAVGDRVLAKWPQETQWWYPGVVCGVEGPKFDVQFDDGDRALLLPDEVRPLMVSVGARVYCRWKGGGSYYPGRVDQAIGAAIHVTYDDGDQEMTSISMVRVNQVDL